MLNRASTPVHFHEQRGASVLRNASIFPLGLPADVGLYRLCGRTPGMRIRPSNRHLIK